MKPKKELLRVVKSSENIVIYDRTGKMPGRGAYICRNVECLQRVIKTKRFERMFEITIDESVYETLKNELGEYDAG